MRLEFLVLITVAISLNILVTLFVFKRDDLETFQKYSQSVIAWLFPIIGALVIYAINKSHDNPYKTRLGPDANQLNTSGANGPSFSNRFDTDGDSD